MYAYIYAPIVGSREERLVSLVETEIGVFGLSGRIHRLSGFVTIDAVIREEVKKKITTIVVVGDEKTFLEAACRLVGTDVVLGYIPFEASPMAGLLGLPVGEGAVSTISGRIIETLDVGRANKQYFIHSLRSESSGIFSFSTKNYKMIAREPTDIECANFGEHPGDSTATMSWYGPKRFLKGEEVSYMPLIPGRLECQGAGRLIIDDCLPMETPCDIEIVPQALRVIVGKHKGWYSEGRSKEEAELGEK